MKFTAHTSKRPRDWARAAKADLQQRWRDAGLYATDKASREAAKRIRAKIKGVGLGKLGGAVGSNSALRKGNLAARNNPWGAVFARGGDESRGGQVLEAYAQGTAIVPRNGNWLWIATRHVPRFVSAGGKRRRTTPETYKRAGLEGSIGKLQFVRLSPTQALLTVRKVTLSPKTGQAKRDTGARVRTRIREKEIVAFVGIRITRRAQRFDPVAICADVHPMVAGWIGERLAR